MVQPGIQESFGQLVDRIRQGDPSAWDCFVKTYDPKLKSVIRNRMRLMNRRLRSIYDTGDFTSEIWKTLMVRLPSLQINDEAAFMGFMTHVAWQKIIDMSRKQTSRKRDSNRDVSIYDPHMERHSFDPKSHEPTPSQYAMAEEIRQELTRESEAVDGDCALIMKLKSQDYTNHEVAEATGMNLRKVQRLLKQFHDRFVQLKRI